MIKTVEKVPSKVMLDFAQGKATPKEIKLIQKVADVNDKNL